MTGATRNTTAAPAAALSVDDLFGGLCATLLDALDDDGRTVLHARCGLGAARLSLWDLAAPNHDSFDDVRARQRRCRRALHRDAAEAVAELRDAGRQLLATTDGFATPDQIPADSVLSGAPTGEATAPFWLLHFCFPTEFFVWRGGLTAVAPRDARRLQRALRHHLRPLFLPRTVEDIARSLSDRGPLTPPPALLRRLIDDAPSVERSMGPGHREQVTATADPRADAAHAALTAGEGAVTIAELEAQLAESGTPCRGQALRSVLRADPRFVEVDADTWQPREHVEDALAAQATSADEVASFVRERGNIDLWELCGDGSRDRGYLVLALLRRDHTLRHLGAGRFCKQSALRAHATEQLFVALRRAMGEIPLQRFLDNHPAEGRDLATRLLQLNRLFIEPAPDRIDMLSNYPLTERDLSELRQRTRFYLRQHGRATLTELAAVVQRGRLRSDPVTDHLFADLVRRHGGYDIDPVDDTITAR
ncbi:MAG: hypothetical protein AAF628_33790 [Planctomycetota bacterium]